MECELCINAHEKIKITKTHRILPYGTVFEFNIGRDLSSCVPETPIPATPHAVQTQRTVQFVEIVPETPSPPTPPPMPSHRAVQYVETIPITPARVIYQRWSNWAHTRLAH